MRHAFQKELVQIQAGLIEAAGYVRFAMDSAYDIFCNTAPQSVHTAQRLAEDDDKIDQITAKIDDLAVEILLLQAPVAKDLRFIVSSMRIGASLERMGDLAVHIAKLPQDAHHSRDMPPQVADLFATLGSLCVSQGKRVHRLIRLLQAEESPSEHLLDGRGLDPDMDEKIETGNNSLINSLIESIINADDKVDNAHLEVSKVLVDLDTGRRDVADIIEYTLANRYFERFSDHAELVAKRMLYLQGLKSNLQ